MDRSRPVPRAIALRLAGSIRHRGMTRQSDWSGGNAWLGHADGGTTPHPGTNLGTNSERPRVVADIRLDNRPELGRALGLRDVTAVSDVDLLLLSYARWGEACCSRLIGDFAFAIWDAAAQTLFCGRDQLGVRPFYYCRRDGLLLFGSEVSGIIDDEPLNEARIVGFILGTADDASSTAFEGISRLPPGSWLRLMGDQLHIARYWAPEAEERVEPVDAVEEFREAFIEAVDARTRDAGALGAMLSGGLDSSSIVSVAAGRGEPLPTYSFGYPRTPELDERRFIDAVIETHKVQPTFVDFDDLAPLRGIGGLADGKSDLFFGPGLPKMSMLFAAAHRQGGRVLLDGHGGDEVVSHGYGRLRELAQDGRWLALYRALRGVSGTFGENPNALFVRYVAVFSPLRRILRQRAPQPEAAAGPLGFLNPDLTQRAGATERYRATQERQRLAGRSERTQQLWNVASPAVADGFEALDRAASRAGVELRFPFFDLRLVSLMLAVPASQKLRDGWPRSILRRGMDGILPPKGAVAARQDRLRPGDFAGAGQASPGGARRGGCRPQWRGDVFRSRPAAAERFGAGGGAGADRRARAVHDLAEPRADALAQESGSLTMDGGSAARSRMTARQAALPYRYALFGLRFASDFELPQLPGAAGGEAEISIVRCGAGEQVVADPDGTSFQFGPMEQTLAWQTVGVFRIMGIDRIEVSPNEGVSDALVALPLLGSARRLANTSGAPRCWRRAVRCGCSRCRDRWSESARRPLPSSATLLNRRVGYPPGAMLI